MLRGAADISGLPGIDSIALLPVLALDNSEFIGLFRACALTVCFLLLVRDLALGLAAGGTSRFRNG